MWKQICTYVIARKEWGYSIFTKTGSRTGSRKHSQGHQGMRRIYLDDALIKRKTWVQSDFSCTLQQTERTLNFPWVLFSIHPPALQSEKCPSIKCAHQEQGLHLPPVLPRGPPHQHSEPVTAWSRQAAVKARTGAQFISWGISGYPQKAQYTPE